MSRNMWAEVLRKIRAEAKPFTARETHRRTADVYQDLATTALEDAQRDGDNSTATWNLIAHYDRQALIEATLALSAES